MYINEATSVNKTESSDIMSDFIPLTKQLQVSNAAHIAYIFKKHNIYMNNLMAYIKSGIDRGHHIIIIENEEIYKEIVKVINNLFSEADQKRIHYINNYEFYRCYEDFNMDSIIESSEKLIQTFSHKQITIRSWARFKWKKQDNIDSLIEEYEKIVDVNINKMKIMVVCAYEASKISASIHMSLMRSHEYIMSDTELVKSSLYRCT